MYLVSFFFGISNFTDTTRTHAHMKQSKNPGGGGGGRSIHSNLLFDIESPPSYQQQQQTSVNGRLTREEALRELGKDIKHIFAIISKTLWQLFPVFVVLFILTIVISPQILFGVYFIPRSESIVSKTIDILGKIEAGIVNAARISIPPLKLIITILTPIGAPWNRFVDAIKKLWNLFWSSNCPNGFHGSILDDCRFGGWYTYIIGNLNFIKLLWVQFKLFFQLIRTAIGSIICEGGICRDPSFCFLNQAPCAYTSFSLLNYIGTLILWFVLRFVWVLYVSALFFIDMLVIPIYLLRLSVEDGFTIFSGVSPTKRLLPDAKTPYREVKWLKNILLPIEIIVLDTAFFILRIGRFVLIIVIDTPQCNIFRDFQNCAAAKTCYTFTKVSIPVICIGDVCYFAHLDFQEICPVFRLYKSKCSCDRAIYEDKELGQIYNALSRASSPNCIKITGVAENPRTTCVYAKYTENRVESYTIDNGPCLCHCSVPSCTDGILVPCVPEQNECDDSISIIPQLRRIAGSLKL